MTKLRCNKNSVQNDVFCQQYTHFIYIYNILCSFCNIQLVQRLFKNLYEPKLLKKKIMNKYNMFMFLAFILFLFFLAQMEYHMIKIGEKKI